MDKQQGKIIVFYGGCSAGKSTLSKALLEYFDQHQVSNWESTNITTQILRFDRYLITNNKPECLQLYQALLNHLNAWHISYMVRKQLIQGPNSFELPFNLDNDLETEVKRISDLLPETLRSLFSPSVIQRLLMLTHANSTIEEDYPIDKVYQQKVIYQSLFDNVIQKAQMGISTILEIIPLYTYDPLEELRNMKEKLNYSDEIPIVWLNTSLEDIQQNVTDRNTKAKQAICRNGFRPMETANAHYETIMQRKNKEQTFDLTIINSRSTNISALATQIATHFKLT